MRLALLTAGITLGSWTFPALAHHSVAAWFDTDRMQELEGIVTEIRWDNPHVRFFLRENESGATWEIETLSVSGISRWGITADLLNVGDQLRVAGSPSRRGLNNLFVRNVLLPGGQELVFGGDARFSDDALRGSEVLATADGDPSRPELGLFRVWSTGANAGWVFPESFDHNFDFSYYPLTEFAQAAVAQFDYVAQDPTNACQPKGMPTIMEQPYPIEFVDQGDSILLRIEEYDQERIIYLRDVPPESARAPSPLGFSVGRIDGRALDVTTTQINSGYFDSVGIPLSVDAVVTERFAPSADGATLNYTLTVTDPAVFTAPVESGKKFIYLPDIRIGRFNCVN